MDEVVGLCNAERPVDGHVCACDAARRREPTRQFQEKLGRSASDLLTDIRMTLAANELKRSSLSTDAVAELVGYQSEAAFQRTYKSHTGVTPAQWRKMQEPSGQDVFARLAVLADANLIRADGDEPTDEPRTARDGDTTA